MALSDNFRSREALLEFINPLFRTLMRPAVGGVAYDPEAELRFGRPDSRAHLTDFSARKLHKRLHTRPRRAPHRLNTYEKAPTCGAFAEPSDGLEPSTPSLPLRGGRNWWQPSATDRK